MNSSNEKPNKKEIENMNLGQLISYVNRYFSKFVDKKLAEYDLTRSQAQFLLSLYHNDHVSQEEICNQFNMSEGTVARSMKRIEDKGLITREVNPNDKRKKIIIITEKGKENAKKIIRKNLEMDKKLNKNLSTEELNQLKASLINLLDLLDE